MPPPDPILIREAVDSDGPALARLIGAVFSAYDGVAFVAAEFPELLCVATHFHWLGGRIWVATDEGVVVGCFGAAPTHQPGVAEFSKVYVAASHRGRGLGGGLLGVALAYLRQRGISRITLWSDVRFLEGHRFYQRHGFRRGPGVRALHDASQTLEFNFTLDLGAGAAS